MQTSPTPHPQQFEQLMAEVRGGSSDALGQLLETYRHYLLQIAEQELDSDLRGKGGASDLVQETFLKAHREFDGFQGASAAELLAWLRTILLRNLSNFSRSFRSTSKRHLAREVALNPAGAGTGLLEGFVEMRSPHDEAVRREQARFLQRALEKLPDHYLQVFLMHYCEERSFEEIGHLTHRSAEASRKIWERTLKCLRAEFEATKNA